MQEKLTDEKKSLEEEFAKLDSEKEKLVEQRKLIDQKLSQIQVRQVQLQGSWQVVEKLLKEDTEPDLKVVN